MLELDTATAAVLVAGVALALLALGGGVARRRAAERRMSAAVADLDGMLGDLRRAVERARVREAWSSTLERLSSSIDLDEVLARTVDAAVALPSVEAAAVRVTGGAEPLVASAKLDEPGRPGGLAVPLAGTAGTVAVLTVYPRAAAGAFAESNREELDELARRAGPANENARRFREARQLADLDALTGLNNRRLFHETLAREVARAERYGRRLALIVLDLDGFKAINDQLGHLAGDSVLAELGARLRSVVRSADIACRIGGEEFAVILPEATLEDAHALYERLREAVSAGPVGRVERLSLSAGMTELLPDDDPATFFERAVRALYRAKRAGKGRVMAAETSA